MRDHERLSGQTRAATRIVVLLALLVLPAALLSTGCNTSCRQFAKKLCNECTSEVEDLYGSEAMCTCIETKALTADDTSEGGWLYYVSDHDAEMGCDRINLSIDHKGSDGDAACQREIQYLNEWGDDACEDSANASTWLLVYGYYYFY